jgi:hypothetical protein
MSRKKMKGIERWAVGSFVGQSLWSINETWECNIRKVFVQDR